MKLLLIILSGFLLFGCNSKTRTENNETNIKTITEQTINFDFDKFKILKGRLGTIKIGMTINQAEQQFTGLTKKVDEAINLGFGGGGIAYLYYSGDDLVFGLIPGFETDTLLYIIAAHKRLKTENGLNPNSTVEELLKIYPEMTVQQNLMTEWEFYQDLTNDWDFIFMTNQQTQIGEYPEIEVPSIPKQLTTKADWIIIR